MEGLVDSFSIDDFQAKIDSLFMKWRNFEISSSAELEKFIEYFNVNKVNVILETMLRPVREECGLGNPPESFTTNSSESINALLKQKVDYKKNNLPDFIEKVKQLIVEQHNEIQRAVINQGKYQFQSQYRFLMVPESQWFMMTSAQRTKHMSKVKSLPVLSPCSDVLAEDNTKHPQPSGAEIQQQHATVSTLSVDANTFAKGVHVPLTCVEGMFRKAIELLNDSEAVTAAPGSCHESRMVLSYSGKIPHLVKPTKGGYCCDSNCANWKSIGFCSHCIAVAELHGKLSQYASSLRKKKKVPNITKLVTSNMPSGRGRKGTVAPRRCKSFQSQTFEYHYK